MRKQFVPPSHNEFLHILNGGGKRKKRGGGLQDIQVFRPTTYRRGGGLFSILKSAAKVAIPFLLKNVLPSVVDGGMGVLNDMSEGKQFKHSVRERGRTAFNEVRGRVAKRGGGNKKKCGVKKACKKKCNKGSRKIHMGYLDKRYKGDVFDHM